MYSEMALKFTEHFLKIASAMDSLGQSDERMWDEEDGFFYDILRYPLVMRRDSSCDPWSALLPPCATTVIEGHYLERFPGDREAGQ